MADPQHLTCITESNRLGPHERITHVGGAAPDGTPWRITERAAIEGIKSGEWAFYVTAQGKNVWVHVALHHGREYLKTEPDNLAPDNLLSLPKCP